MIWRHQAKRRTTHFSAYTIPTCDLHRWHRRTLCRPVRFGCCVHSLSSLAPALNLFGQRPGLLLLAALAVLYLALVVSDKAVLWHFIQTLSRFARRRPIRLVGRISVARPLQSHAHKRKGGNGVGVSSPSRIHRRLIMAMRTHQLESARACPLHRHTCRSAGASCCQAKDLALQVGDRIVGAAVPIVGDCVSIQVDKEVKNLCRAATAVCGRCLGLLSWQSGDDG